MAAPPLELSKSALKLPKGWREALYAETDDGWASAHGGAARPKEQPLPSSPQRSGGAGRPNALLVELLASRQFIDDYFEKLPLLLRRVEDSSGPPPRQPLCSLSEDQLLMREFHVGHPRDRRDVERPCVEPSAACLSGTVGPNTVQFAFGLLDQFWPEGAEKVRKAFNETTVRAALEPSVLNL